MSKADFVTGLAFVALGLAALVGALAMPRFESLGANPYTVPGIVPGLLGVVIAVLGAVLVLRAARAGGWRLGLDAAAFRGLAASPDARRFGIALALTVGYAGGLIGLVPFWLATGIFVFAFIAAFEWPLRSNRRRLLVTAAVQAALVSAAVSLVFRYVFLVTLP